MDDREHFLAALNDLDECYASSDDYGMLRASALLRKLLIDKMPLVHRLNRPEVLKRAKLKLTFPFVSRIEWDLLMGGRQVEVPRPKAEFLGDLSVVDLLPSMKRNNLPLDQFLNFPFARVGDTKYSARRIIQYVAHVSGGVHAGAPDADQRQLLDAQANIDALLMFFDAKSPDLVFGCLRAISGATLRGLEPLGRRLHIRW